MAEADRGAVEQRHVAKDRLARCDFENLVVDNRESETLENVSTTKPKMG